MSGEILDEINYPDLKQLADNRATGRLLALSSIGQVRLDDTTQLLVSTFCRIVDSSCLEYQIARTAYFSFYHEPNLGGSVPISEYLVPSLSHIENCISNTSRALKLAQALRQRKTTANSELISRIEWGPLKADEQIIRNLRDTIQHMDSKLIKGQPVGGVYVTGNGHLKIDNISMPLAAFSLALKRLHGLTDLVITRARTK